MSNRAVILLALAVGLLAGCADRHEHERLDLDSPHARRVRQMVDAVREAGLDRLSELTDRDAAGGLTPGQSKALAAALAEVAAADTVELLRMDSFGPQVVRATLRLRRVGREQTVAFLLVETDAGLRWAGRN